MPSASPSTPDEPGETRGQAHGEPVFLDTNVFVYAAGSVQEARDPSLRNLQAASKTIVLAVGEGKLEAFTSVVVLQEVLYLFHRWSGYRGRPELREIGVELALDILALVQEVFPTTALECQRALQTFDPHREDFNDRLILEAMRSHAVRRIVTADRRFPTEAGFQVLHPVDWAETLRASE